MIFLKEFAEALKETKPNSRVFKVGGCVRDSFLNRTPKDIDIVVTGITQEELEKQLLSLHVKFDTVGKSFGVTKAKFSEGEIDIALPRREQSTGTGHKDFAVEFGPEVTIEEDAKRRDFTMNAISQNVLTGEIVDPCNGLSDLKYNTLQVTSEKAFEEDPLRILRAVQFCARFGLCPSNSTAGLMFKNAEAIKTVSPERIAIELEKLLLADCPSVGFKLMQQTDLLSVVLPELDALVDMKQPEKFHNATAFEHTLRVVDAVRPDLNMRFAALFHDLGKATTRGFEDRRITFHGHEGESVKRANEIIDRLKLFTLEGFDREFICTLVGNHMFGMTDKNSIPSIRRLVRRIGGIDRFQDLVQLRIADKIGGANQQTIWKHLEFLKKVIIVAHENPVPSLKDLAVDGNDIMKVLEISPGPKIGEVLKKLFNLVENNEILNEKGMLLECCLKFKI